MAKPAAASRFLMASARSKSRSARAAVRSLRNWFSKAEVAATSRRSAAPSEFVHGASNGSSPSTASMPRT